MYIFDIFVSEVKQTDWGPLQELFKGRHQQGAMDIGWRPPFDWVAENRRKKLVIDRVQNEPSNPMPD